MALLEFKRPDMVNIHVPEALTKQIKIGQSQGKRRVVLSTNWLLLMGFKGADTPVVYNSLGDGQGFTVDLANEEEIKSGKTNLVYTRYYNSRSANPLKTRKSEKVIQVTRKELIEKSLGSCATHVHVTFRYGQLVFKPLTKQAAKLVQDFQGDDTINTFVAMTGGVDCHALEKNGFGLHAVLEYRPQAKRDKTDYTEMTSVSALVNSKPKYLINEDIYSLDSQRMAELISDAPITFGHFSISCDDFSTLKTHQHRENSLEDLSSSVDMFIPMLGIIDALNLPVVLVENVPGFHSSPIHDVLTLQLKRRGFNVHSQVFDSRTFGGLTGRKRMYMVASTLEAPFVFPEASENHRDCWVEAIKPNLDKIIERDVTDNKVTQDGINTGRIRMINKDKQFSPTLVRAQGNQTKDSCYVEHEGRIYRPDIESLKALSSIDKDFDLDWCPIDKAEQIIGQSICGALHEQILMSVKSHIHTAARMFSDGVTQARGIAQKYFDQSSQLEMPV